MSLHPRRLVPYTPARINGAIPGLSALKDCVSHVLCISSVWFLYHLVYLRSLFFYFHGGFYHVLLCNFSIWASALSPPPSTYTALGSPPGLPVCWASTLLVQLHLQPAHHYFWGMFPFCSGKVCVQPLTLCPPWDLRVFFFFLQQIRRSSSSLESLSFHLLFKTYRAVCYF